LRPARAFREALRNEIQTVHRHLDKARDAFELASIMDPRFKHLPSTRSSEEREGIRAKAMQAAVDTYRAAEMADEQQQRPEPRRAPNSRRPGHGQVI
jgi:hypothetical protein